MTLAKLLRAVLADTDTDEGSVAAGPVSYAREAMRAAMTAAELARSPE